MYYIGVFWIYKNQIYSKSIDKDTVKVINGFVDSDFSHYQVWEEISLQNKEFYLYEYEIINSDEAKSLIIKDFNLKVDKVLFKYDEHYKIISSV